MSHSKPSERCDDLEVDNDASCTLEIQKEADDELGSHPGKTPEDEEDTCNTIRFPRSPRASSSS